MDTSLDKKYYGNIKFPEADSCTGYVRKYSCAKNTLKYLGIKDHNICKLPLNGPEKLVWVYVHLHISYRRVQIYVHVKSANNAAYGLKMLTIGKYGQRLYSVLYILLIFASFLYVWNYFQIKRFVLMFN